MKRHWGSGRVFFVFVVSVWASRRALYTSESPFACSVTPKVCRGWGRGVKKVGPSHIPPKLQQLEGKDHFAWPLQQSCRILLQANRNVLSLAGFVLELSSALSLFTSFHVLSSLQAPPRKAPELPNAVLLCFFLNPNDGPPSDALPT